ncbi:MAG TPA: 2-hydroxyacid dehydrogenase [Acidimicrobiales bacterium]|nr:2-hydroxyacid dehydrogenase [Acidimicrobiales bacterium]
MRRIVVLASNGPERSDLGRLPDGVELVADATPEVEFLVLDPALMNRVPALFSDLPALRVVQSTFAGVETLVPHVPAGVVVASGSGAHDISVSEWIISVLLAMKRRLPDFVELQRQGTWDKKPYGIATGTSLVEPIDDIEGSTVLIVGYGSIGHALEARLLPFGVRVLGVARHARPGADTPDQLPKLVPQADVVVILAPLTEETERLVDATFLSLMKRGAILINAARGRLVDTDALVDALNEGRVRAALDVTDPEPLPTGHPLWKAPNVLITPHVGGASARWINRAFKLAGDQIRRYAAGEPLRNVVVGEIAETR